jgi:amino acid adenylation domain-containing protein/non-ribosomal peptide synthase protein (TIGR01720 family)
MRLNGPLDTGAFSKALNEIVRRHESLRTSFVDGESGPRQIVCPAMAVPFETTDLSHAPDVEAAAREMVRQECVTPFDLEHAPLLRVKLLKLGKHRHICVFNMHHIVCDAWSLDVMMRELVVLYPVYTRGGTPSLPDPKIQYRDYALWQNQFLSGAEAKAARNYWMRKLGGCAAGGEVRPDWPRSAVQTFSGDTVTVKLDAAVRDQLRSLSARNGASLFMTLLAAIKVLLYRYTGQEDITVGTVTSGRHHPDLEDQVGFYVNTLALRDHVRGTDRFVDVLESVKSTLQDGLSHEAYPFDRLVEELSLDRDMSRSPLFDTMVTFSEEAGEGMQLGDAVRVSAFDAGLSVAKFDLTFAFAEQRDGLHLELTYNSDLYRENRALAMAGHVSNILLAVAIEPSLRLSEIALLSKVEMHQVTQAFQRVDRDVPEETVVQLFAQAVAATPSAVALVDGERSISYAELNGKANQLAHYLKAEGIGPDSFVGILAERSIELVTGVLAVVKAGGAYVPMDPAYPEKRLAYMIEDSGIKIVLTQQQWLSKLDKTHTVFCLDRDFGFLPGQPAELPLEVGADNLAYMIYTSGSTGQPKGTMICHQGLSNLVAWHHRDFGIKATDRATMVAGPAFDASVWELWPYLTMGAAVYIVPPEVLGAIDDLCDWLVEKRITVSFLPTPLAESVMTRRFVETPALRFLLTGGDTLRTYPDPSLPFRVVNNYGPTENTVVTTSGIVGEDPGRGMLPDLGKPILNHTVYILDAALQPVPGGVPGELCVSGPGLARGYWKRAELTAERFIPNPFSTDPAARLYRTGDLVRWLADGRIEFMGRMDQQVKIRGFRVELGEIEALLRAEDSVADVVVRVLGEGALHAFLVAYVVPQDGGRDHARTPDALRQHLRRNLPDYMVPSEFLLLAKIPVTPNGKVDFKALPQPERTGVKAAFEAPQGEWEQKLAVIFSEILDVSAIGRNDDFFAMGGHSLKATRLVARIHKELHTGISIRDVFQHPTLAGLAAVIGGKARGTYAGIEPVAEAQDYPVSHAQRRLWIMEGMGINTSAYNLPSAFMLEGNLDEKALAEALKQIVVRHESLRTTFFALDEKPWQRVHGTVECALEIVDAVLPLEEESAVLRMIESEAMRSFDLEKGPLFRAKLFRLGRQRSVLFLCLHHIISDGWSMGVFFKELLSLYGALSAGKKNPLAPLRIQYRDFAAWQNAILDGQKANIHRDYWRTRFAGDIPVLEFPTDHARPAVQTFKGASYGTILTAEMAGALRQISQDRHVSLFMTCVALVKVLLYRYTGQEDIVVGAPVAGREHEDLMNEIGFYVNMLALRDSISGKKRFADFLQTVGQTVAEGLQHQVYPFDRLVEELQIARDMGRSPLFDVAVLMENTETVNVKIPGLQVDSLDVSSGSSKFDLTFAFSETADGRLLVGLEYSTDLFDPDRVERMAGHLKQLVASVIADPETRVGELEILPAWERRKVLETFTDTRTAYPRNRGIAQVFEEQVQRTPEAPAVQFGDRVFTYGELNARANRLAHHLRSLGVGPDVLVGVFMERSLEMITALLGILKAGGAYVPLDPDYPAERIAFMLADTGLQVLLTQAKLSGRLPSLTGGNGSAVAEVICLDRAGDKLASYPTEDLPPVAGPEDLAYVMYTSGSTGQPKGSSIPQRAVVRLVKHTNFMTFGRDDIFLQYAPVSFDAATLEIWGPLLNGGKLVLLPPGNLSLAELGAAIRGYKVTSLWLTSSLFNLMVDEQMADLAGVRQLLSGGDVLSVRHVRKALAGLPGCRLINGYGPTENTTFTCCHTITSQEEDQSVPIGRPIANTQVYVLDPWLHPVPVGVAGELYIGGDGLARDYYKRPELTAQRFVEVSPGAGISARLYRTGDRVRYRPDGNIEFLGRLDEQVKIRGFRIEPGEIETALGRHPAVRDGVVVVKTDAVGSKRLVAYVVAHAGTEVPAEDVLLDFLKELLPDYMVPAVFVMMEQLPLSPNGKVDRKALPDPDFAKTGGREYVAPRNDRELVLAETWQGVLGREQVGADDNFFDLGGDSIRAIQIVSRLKRAGWSTEVREVFQYPTLCGLAERLKTAGAAAPEQRVEGELPLSAVQRWFFENHKINRAHFNQSVLLSSCERLEESVLHDVLGALQAHHDALRLVFMPQQGRLVQRYAEFLPVNLEVVDLGDKADGREIMTRHAHETQASIDLEKGPLMKAVLYRRTGGDLILLVVHHLAVDGVSWRILLEDLEQGYRQAARKEPLDFGSKTASYKAWAVDQASYGRSENLTNELPYWKTVLSTPAAMIPVDDKTVSNTYGLCEVLEASLGENETTQLLTRAHSAYHTEVNDVLLAGLGRALKNWHGGHVSLLTMEGHGREPFGSALDVGRTVGWFTSLYPLVLHVDGEDVGYQLRSVKESLRQVPGRGMGFGILRYVAAEDSRKELSGLPEPQISFNYLGQFGEGQDKGLFRFSEEPQGRLIGYDVERRTELDIGAMVVHGRLTLSVMFVPGRHSRQAMHQLLRDFRKELLEVVKHCLDRPVPEKTPSDFTACPFGLAGYESFLHTHSLAPARIEDMYPLSPMQEGLLFQSLLDRDSRAYFIQTSYRLKGNISIEHFCEGLKRVCRRHAALRTAFVFEDLQRPLQIVLAEKFPEIKQVDFTDIPAGEQQEKVEAWRQADMDRGFDLQRDSLIRVTIFRFGPADFVFVWSCHHVLIDGWSLGLIYRDLIVFQEALAGGVEPQLPPVASYRDYIRWLEARPKAEGRDYWKHYLDGYAGGVSVPGRAQKAADGFIPGERILAFDEATTLAMKALAANEGVTLNTIFQCIWALLLARYNGVEDVVFGAVVSGRPPDVPGVEDMVGLFINAIPVRLFVRGTERFRDILHTAQQAALDSEKYHYLSLADVQSLSLLGRDLFDHIMVFENYPVDRELGKQGAGSRDLFSIEGVKAHDRTHYDFDITVLPGSRLEVKFAWNELLFEKAQMDRVVTHFAVVAQGLIRDPDQPVADVDMMPDGERALLLRSFNDTAQVYPQHKTLVDLLEEQAKKTPDRVAVVCGGEEITYRELHERANRLAHRLQKLGVGPDVAVGICVDRGMAMIAGVLGIIKAGGAYVPLDPEYPEERLNFMLRDSGMRVLVTLDVLCDRILPQGCAEKGLTVVCLDKDGDTIAAESAESPVCKAGPGNLAYIIYTSGSTGRPKGVMVEHGNLVNAAYAWRQEYGLDQFDVRLLQMASLSFDVFAGDLIRALTNGGCVVVCPSDVRVDPPALYDLMAKHQVNIFESTPGLIVPLMEYIHEGDMHVDFLKLLILGSDSVSGENFQQLVERFGSGMRILNSYGVTEATVDSSYFEGAAPDGSGSTPIGKPLPNTLYYVLDPMFRPVPVGVAGELYIGGAGVARGYLNRPELTTEKFLTDPFFSGGRVYRTGDIARWRSDGNLVFLGRGDDQVKVRGYRIETGEIENVILQYGAVRGAVVLARDLGGSKELVAYVSWKDSGGRAEATAVSAVRAFMGRVLPEYMIPSFFVELDDFPLSPNGKVDRNALPDPERSAGQMQEPVAPRTTLESELVELWQDILQVEKVGIHDDFFVLGGHSLKAMQIVSRVHKRYGARIDLRDFFTGPTVEKLAALVEGSGFSLFSEIQPVPVQPYYELSHAQKRLWLLHQMDVRAAYNMPEAYILENIELDLDALNRVFRKLAERHEALRTGFETVEGEPRQKILASVDFKIRALDLSMDRDAEAEARRIMTRDAMTPFDLSKPPLLRVFVMKLGARKYVFGLVMHHIIGDGWSGTVLYRELLALYGAYCRGKPDPLKPLRIQYKDFAAWQLRKGFEKEEQYWGVRLRGMPDQLRLQYDMPAREDRDFGGATEALILGGGIAAGLKRLAQQKSTTLSNVVLALFGLFLYQLTRQDDFCVGMSIANRNHPDVENLIGFFVNILPVRVQVTADMEFDELLEQTIRSTYEAFEHQDYPFDLLVQKLRPERLSTRQPLINVVYGFQNFQDVRVDIGQRHDEAVVSAKEEEEVRWRELGLEFETSKFDLTLFVSEEKDRLQLHLEYDTGLFHKETIRRYLGTLERFAGMLAESVPAYDLRS